MTTSGPPIASVIIGGLDPEEAAAAAPLPGNFMRSHSVVCRIPNSP